ncbi:MAG TPA: phosphoribosylglycinamide formyltransferase, partial [Candidatus Saccharimonadia bacterium]|jgi:phosphoribosylglycinamide formyltransferase-1|nr:phosphoribosylglycinamide formyltransferase [Candidatus Saccharimonadia bacterium]
VPTELIQRTSFNADFNREAYTKDIMAVLDRHKIDLVAMAGFMTILSAAIFNRYRGKIINTHPSLLPDFKGENAVQQALDAGVEVTGCTIHEATAELDNGPILAQVEVPVKTGDTLETLWERIKETERVIYPETLRKLMQGGDRP